jgi:tetratricopeptide (TPR) repeat protein
VAEPTPVMARPAPGAIDPGLAEMFEEFRVLAEGEGGANGDYETHYNLGLAYKEMDLFEEALEEFQVAVGLTSAGDGTSRYLQCCNLLGHCFLQKGEPRLALRWFNKGLTAPGHSEDEYQALRYDLGSAYEQMGDIDHALEIFTEIYGVNISYRGVKEKVRDLQSRRGTSRGPGRHAKPSSSRGEKSPPVNGKPHKKTDHHARRD